MKIEAFNRLTMLRSLVSAVREPVDPRCYGWIWVLPLPDGRYRVASVDIPRRLVDEDEDFFEEDFSKPFVDIAETVDEIDDLVRAAGGNPDLLDAPWKNNFPL